MPPRAQAEHQKHTRAMNKFLEQMKRNPLNAYQYKAHGTRVARANLSSVGMTMGYLTHVLSMI